MRILQVSTMDRGGGAEAVMQQLAREYRRRDHEAWLAVGLKSTDDPAVIQIPNDALRAAWARSLLAAGAWYGSRLGRVRGFRRIGRAAPLALGQPRRWLVRRSGLEDFDFPATRLLAGLTPHPPDVVHCHNLHGETHAFFDLGVLPDLSRTRPLVLTLHDAWLLAGHCAHSFECSRWETGCGACPDLTIYPAVRRDRTAENWERKRALYRRSRLYVATPSEWLMRRVERSMLRDGIVEARVIPNGVDLATFAPGVRRGADRAALGLRRDARVLLFVANTVRANPWKDFETLDALRRRLAADNERSPVELVVLGEGGTSTPRQPGQPRFIGYETDPKLVARVYRCADVYVHAAHVDTFPNTVLEALACGIPVVATAVGGVPEQLRGLAGAGPAALNRYDASDATGVLVEPRDVAGMHAAVKALLGDETLRSRLGENAARDAAARFDSSAQAEAYLEWYEELLSASVPARAVSA
jgi:glycosyltransferase involved in cell wall biosynthesis